MTTKLRTRLYKTDIAARVRRTPRSVDLWVASGKFPRPHHDEIGRRFWWQDEIEAHEAELLRNQGAA